MTVIVGWSVIRDKRIGWEGGHLPRRFNRALAGLSQARCKGTHCRWMIGHASPGDSERECTPRSLKRPLGQWWPRFNLSARFLGEKKLPDGRAPVAEAPCWWPVPAVPCARRLNNWTSFANRIGSNLLPQPQPSTLRVLKDALLPSHLHLPSSHCVPTRTKYTFTMLSSRLISKAVRPAFQKSSYVSYPTPWPVATRCERRASTLARPASAKMSR
jgi:hypothetical protein